MAETVENLEANVRVNARQGEITLRRVDRELDRMSRDRRGRIKIAVDDTEAKRAQKNLSLLNSALLKLPAYAAAGASALGPLTAGVGALGAGVVGLTSSLASLGGFAAGLGPLLFNGAAAMGTFKLATLGVADAAKEYSSALIDGTEEGKKKLAEIEKQMSERLSPAASQLAKDLAEAQLGLQEIGKTLNTGLLVGLQVGLSDMMGLLDQLTPSIKKVGDSLAVEIQQITGWLSNSGMRNELQRMLGDASMHMRRVSDIVTSLGNAFVHVMDAARPFTRFMVDGTVKMAAGIEQWAAMGRLTGNLAERFEQAADAGRDWWAVLKNTGGALMGTLDAARPFTDWFMDRFVAMTAKWDDWTNSLEGRNSIAEFFEEAKGPLSETAGLIGDLWKVLSRQRDPEGFTSFVRMLRNDVVPAIERLMVATKDSGIFDNLVRGVADAIDVFGRLAGGGLISSSIELLANMLDVVNDLTSTFPFLSDAITGAFAAFSLLRIAGVGGPVLTGLTALSSIVMAVTGDVNLLVPAIAGLGGAFAGFKIAGAIRQLQMFSDVFRTLKGMGSIAERLGYASEVAFGRIGTGAGKAAGGAKGLAGALAGAGGLTALSTGLGIALAGAAVGFTVWQQESAKAKQATDDFRAAIESIQTPDQVQGTILSQVWSQAEAKKIQDDLRRLGWDAEDFTNKIINANLTLVESGGKMVLQQKANRDGLQNVADVINNEMTPALRRNFEALDAVGGTTENNVEAIGYLSGVAADAANSFIEEQIALKGLTEEQVNAIYEQNKLADGGYNLIGIIEDVTSAINAEEEAQRKLNEAIAAGHRELDLQKNFLQEYINGRRNLAEAEEDTIEVHQRAIQTIKENGNVWDINTEKGRANRDMLRALYDSYVAQAQGAIQAGESVESASSKYDAFVLTLIGLEKQGLIAKGTSDELAESLGLTAKDWDAQLRLTTIEQGELKLMFIKSALEGMDDKGLYETAIQALVRGDTATLDRVYRQATDLHNRRSTEHIINVTTRYREVMVGNTKVRQHWNYFGEGNTLGRKGAHGFIQMADGGLTPVLPQQAIIQRPRRNLIQWAEPETGGEAFIPLARSKRARSIKIWQKTGELLGINVMPGVIPVSRTQINSFASGGVRGSFTGFTPWQWGLGYYNAQRNKMLELRAPSNYAESAKVRLFIHGVMTQMAKLGARIKQTGFGEWDFDITGVKGRNLHQIGRILDGLSSGGFSMNVPYDTGSSVSAQRQVPYVVINEATFKDEADLKALESTLEWSVRTERI